MGSPRWIGQRSWEEMGSSAESISGRDQSGARYAHGSTNLVAETDGGVGESGQPEHDGPEQGLGRRGPSECEGSPASVMAMPEISGSR